MAAKEKTNQNEKLLKTVIALLLVFVLLMASALCWFLLIRPKMDKSIKGGQREADALQGSISQMTEEEIQQALNDIVDEGMFRISIASDIIAIEKGKAELRIENNIQNRYIMQVSIYLNENGKEIYSTDLIDPGYYIQSAELDRHLEPGEYEATAVFTALYPDTEEVVGTVGANVKIYVFPNAESVPTPSPTAEA